jgi:hypothetical protein
MQATDRAIIERMLDVSRWAMDAKDPDFERKHKRGGDPENKGRFSAKGGPGYVKGTAEYNKKTGGHLARTAASMEAAPVDMKTWPSFIREAAIAQPTFFDPKTNPSGWRAIRIAKSKDAYYYVMGVDKNDTWQYVRGPNAVKSTDTEKFDRIDACRKEFPALQRENEAYAKNPAALVKKLGSIKPAVKITPADAVDLTACQRLIQLMAIRIGGQETKAKEEARGAVDLEAQHVKMRADGMHLEFWAKGYTWMNLLVTDPLLKADLAKRAKGSPSKPLFPGANYTRMLGYTKALDKGKFVNHDYRGRLETDMADKIMAKMPVPKNPKEYAKACLAVAQKTAPLLGHLPTESLKSYIVPKIFAKWRASAGV